jgi:2-haloacid dehalogenase
MFVFDAYGTLLDVDSVARQAATEQGMEALKENWRPIAKGWRERQLRCSWLCSMMGKYEDFWELTTRALDATLEEHALASDYNIRNRALSLYSELSAYDEVPEVLANLKADGHRLAVLSNASPSMLEKTVESAGISEWFDCAPRDVTFFSSNNWDVSGAGAFGFKTIWVNRAGAAWDKLPGSPDRIVTAIAEGTKSAAH